MPKQIHLNAFEMNTIGHLSHGLWRHPSSTRHHYTDAQYWIELAHLLEKGKFDAVFFADVVGVYDTYKQTKDVAIAQAVQVPNNDPVPIISMMAAVTKHLGFAVTSSTSYEPPFSHARRLSTLDHITKGRIAWNVVTSHLPNAAKNYGLDDIVQHDERYEIADEYLDVCYKLWEGSWEDDAIVRDAKNGIYTDPSKVHAIAHVGKHFSVEGPHLCEPSLQRTPVIYQAGTSSKGRSFAAKHAECVFLEADSLQELAEIATDIREKASAYGRDPQQLKMFTGMSVIVAPTTEEALEKLKSYNDLISVEGILAHYGGGSGYDLAVYDREDYLTFKESNHIQTTANRFTKKDRPAKSVGEIIDSLTAIETRGLLAVGTPTEVVDRIEEWVAVSGIDGFNVRQIVSPDSFRDFVELVIPELQRRGLFRQEYEDGTFRERLFGQGKQQLPATHPGAQYRKWDVNV